MILTLKIILLLALTQLIACGSAGSSEPVVNNQAPPASAGSDQYTDENTDVIIIGNATDTDGAIASIQWQQTQGPSVELVNTSLLELRFKAPVVLASAGEQSLTFLLTVIDNEGASATDTVTIIVEHINEDPIANAGQSQTFLIAETITLDCGDSKDADSDFFTVEWLQISGEKALLKQSNNCQSSVQLPANAGVIEFQLNITDGDLITVSDTVVVAVKAY